MKAIVVGSINVDRVFDVKRIVKEGETIISSSEKKFLGGKGLNQAIALSQLHHQVYFYTNINPNNQFVIEQLDQYSFNYDLSNKKDLPMGEAIIQVDKHGENAIILSPNANRLIDAADVQKALDHFSKGDILIVQNEINGVPEIIKYAKSKGLTIVLNPSPVTKELTKEVIQLVDYLILNTNEVQEISGSEWTKEALHYMTSTFSNVELIVTLGEDGVFYFGKHGKHKVASYEVEVIDTTCAGDTFLGYFMGSIINGVEVEKALKIASKAASICITVKGASNSIPKKDDVM